MSSREQEAPASEEHKPKRALGWASATERELEWSLTKLLEWEQRQLSGQQSKPKHRPQERASQHVDRVPRANATWGSQTTGLAATAGLAATTAWKPSTHSVHELDATLPHTQPQTRARTTESHRGGLDQRGALELTAWESVHSARDYEAPRADFKADFAHASVL
jgi:hypothetical protein